MGEVWDCQASLWSGLYVSSGKVPASAASRLHGVEEVFVFGLAASEVLRENLGRILGKAAHRIQTVPPAAEKIPATDYQCRQLQAIGIEAMPPPPAVIAPAAEEVSRVAEYIKTTLAARQRLVLIHPGSGGLQKLWHPSGWQAVIRELSSYAHLRLGLLWGPADRKIIGLLQPMLQQIHLLTMENWPLGRVAALLKKATLYLGNDSGITHLAAACGVPTIAIFGPTDPRIWGPRGPRVKIITRKEVSPAYESATHISLPSTEPPAETEQVLQQAEKWLGFH